MRRGSRGSTAAIANSASCSALEHTFLSTVQNVKETVNLPGKPIDPAVRYGVKDEDNIGTVSGDSHFHRSVPKSLRSSGPMLVKMAKRGQNAPDCACRVVIVDDTKTMHIPLGSMMSGAAARR